MPLEMWSYREAVMADPTANLEGFAVEAVDGSIGKVDQETGAAGPGYLVVDTGPWIFGRQVIIPAGAISSVDLDEEVVYVDLSKDQIKDSPEYDPMSGVEDDYLDRLGSYYTPFFGRP
ncbi:MAG TPA: PRC-barrel domain-containing protein [Acidimicrobiia bacterium]|nr:PRC-barrel domain-containing protein [Acidimicrobiia bacterium]